MRHGLLAAALVVAGVSTAEIPDPVRIEQGLVSGVSAGQGLRVFKGLPFGAPPVAELHWRAPRP